MGEVRHGGAVRRSGAQPGDQLYVSGRLGLSASGLRRLRSSDAQAHRASAAVRAHLYPEPRCGLGRYLSQKLLASALIDLSDGLSTDLGHLCRASGVGARVWAERLPLPESEDGRRSRARDSLELALHGGEDYELLFTVPPDKVGQVPPSFRGLPLHHIGEIRRSRNVSLIRPDGKPVPLRPAGYDHFRK
jgi:thiamine-monophosphate kinase